MAVDYNQIAKNLSQKGYEPLKQISVVPTEITGTMNKLFDIVRTGEYAAGGILSGVGIKKGIKQKISPSDALGITNTATRLIADIFLDPTTYLTFGAGGGAKIATKTGASITLTKAGTREFVSLSKKIGAEKARKEFAEILVRNPNYIDKSGLKFMGQTIIPKKSFDAIGSTVKNTIVKVPYVDKLGNIAEKTVDMFNPLAKLSKDTEAGQFATKYNLFLKSTRAQEYRTIEAIAKAEKQYIKKHGKEFAKNVSKYIEDEDSLLKMPASMVDDVKRVGDEIISIQNKIAKEELALGILKSTLGADKFVKAPKVVKNIVEKYTDDIFTGAIKTADEFKKTLTRKESEALKNLYKQGNKKYTAGKIFNIISNSYITPDNYIRHVLTEKGRKFLEKEGSFMNALPKPLRVKLRAGDMRKMGGTIDEINKVMRSKVGGDLFEPDAFKALAYRRGESIRAIETYKFLDEVKKSSYAVKALPGEVSRNIDGIKYIRSTNKQLEGRLFPEPIVRELDKTVEFLTGDKATKELLSGYDKLLTFWKGSVTGWFPAFHTRNFIGGTFNNWLSRMNPKYYKMSVDLQRDLKKGGNKIWVSATGETFTSKQLIKIIEDSGAINQPGMVDVMKKVEDIVGSTKMKQLGNYPKILLEGVENNLRIPLFMDRFLGRGYSAADAAKDVFKFHFDYAPEGLTAFERNVMKRIIPFFTWTRNNIPLQIEQMIKQPGKYAMFPKLQQDIGGKIGEEEFQDLPEWMQNMMVVRIGEEGGSGLWLQLNLPIEDLNKLPLNPEGVREIVSMMSPILKVPTEIITNRNLFFGTEIVNPDLPKELQTAKTIKQLKMLPEPIKDFLNFKEMQYKGKDGWETRYEMDAVKLHILKGAIGRFYDTIGKAFDEDVDAKRKMLRLIGGLPVYDVDIKEQRYWDTYEKQKEEKAIEGYYRIRRFEE